MSKGNKTNTDDEGNTLNNIIFWSVKIPKDKNPSIGETNSDEINTSDVKTCSDTCSSDDNMDIDEREDFTESTCVSDYIKQNSTITSQKSVFEEINFDQNTIINGVEWRAALIEIWSGCTVSCINGGSLYLAKEGSPDLKIVGENSKYGSSAVGEIIEG